MKILVTGGTGFTGKRVLPRLEDKGEITVFARPTSDTSLAESLGYRIAHGDLEDPAALGQALEGHRGLINIASMGFGHVRQIVDAAEAAGVERALFVSTTSLFTKLPAPSKKIRLAAEADVMDSGLAWTILRPTMVYGGPDDRNMCRLLKVLRRYPIVPIPGDGKGRMQPIHVEDLADAIVAAFFVEAAIGKAYNLSGAAPMTFDEIIDAAATAVGRRPWKVHVPMSPLLVLSGIYERIRSRPRIKKEQLLRLLEDKSFSHAEATRDFGFQPRGFQEGIQQAAAS